MIRFSKLSEIHLEKVLDWRTSEYITRYMFTDLIPDIDKHKEWYKKVSQDPTSRYWIIEINNKPSGLISLNKMDFHNRHSVWGYYVGEEDARKLGGGIFPPYFYNYVFANTPFIKLTAEVMEGNDRVCDMHEFHGYRKAGTLKQHIFKYNRFHDLYLFELLRDDWLKQSDQYGHFMAEFEE